LVDSGQVERAGEASVGMTLIALGSSMINKGDPESVIMGTVLVALGFTMIMLREIRKTSPVA
jgi:hypothetical protein